MECPKCGHINLGTAINCEKCRINLEWAREQVGKRRMTKQKLTLEVTDCTLMENGDVLISPDRGRGIFVIVLGLPIALVGLWLLSPRPWEANSIVSIFLPLDDFIMSIFILALGGVLSYVGVRAFTAPEISIEAANRVTHVRAPGSQSAQTWPFDALMEGQPVNVTAIELGFSLVRVSLRFDDGKSLSLFTTGDKKKAQEVIRWLKAAFTTNGVGSPVDAEI